MTLPTIRNGSEQLRTIQIDHVDPGMVVGKNIFTFDGRVLLRKGTTLSERYIKTLRDLQFSQIYVRDPRLPEVEINDIIPEGMRQQAIQIIHKCFTTIQQQVASGKPQPLNIDPVFEMTSDIVDSILANKDLVIQLTDLRSKDHYTYAHCVNCCVVGTVLGHKLGLTEGKLKELAVGLILHDLGMATIPAEILSKPAKLTEEEYAKVKEHSRAGFDVLRELWRLSALAKIVVLQHHERFDGSGYPKGLRGKDIHLYGQIGAIADVYDALTSDRPYRKRLLPHEVIEFLMGNGDRYFSLELVTAFVSTIAPYPLGTLIKLSTGEMGIVSELDMAFATRPTVCIVEDPRGEELAPPYSTIDLRRERSLTITKVLAD